MLFCIGTGEPGAPAPAEGGGSVLRLLSNQNFNPTRLIVVSFGAIILLGTFLLHLPISARDGQFTPWLTCLFTATSATCVTGLVLVDSALYWTPFGQGVILAMIQLGGLGFVSLISLIPLLLRRRIAPPPPASGQRQTDVPGAHGDLSYRNSPFLPVWYYFTGNGGRLSET